MRLGAWLGILASVVGTLLAGACAEDTMPVRYETEHLRIGTDFDDDVCAGSLAELETHVVFISDQLGIPIDDPIELYWYEHGTPPQCDGIAWGCYDSDVRRAYAPWGAAPHELGHAVADLIENGDDANPVFEEGVADAFVGTRTEFGWQSPTLALGAESTYDVDRPSMGHFVRWLHARDGADNLRELLERSSDRRGVAHAERAFEKAYGRPIEDLEAEYWETAPEISPAELFCDLPSIGSATEGFDARVTLDCAEDHTRGIRWMERSFTFTVEKPGSYVFELPEPARMLLWYCHTEPVELGEDRPVIVEPVHGGARIDEELRRPDDWWIEPGATWADLDVGVYRVDFRVESQGTSDAGLRAHPVVQPSRPP